MIEGNQDATEELEAQGRTVVEDAGHYATEENLYVSAGKRADREPEVRTLRRRQPGPERPDDRGTESRAEDPDSE
ncbi:hypothetical protein ABIB51_002002 [Arthrobacter sp. UYCu712]